MLATVLKLENARDPGAHAVVVPSPDHGMSACEAVAARFGSALEIEAFLVRTLGETGAISIAVHRSDDRAGGSLASVTSPSMSTSYPARLRRLLDGADALDPRQCGASLFTEQDRGADALRLLVLRQTDNEGARFALVTGFEGDVSRSAFDRLCGASFTLASAPMASLFASQLAPAPRRAGLTVRELHCLRWTAEGKTSEEIAIILSLSVHTVNHYLTSATRKLDAVNRLHAVARAMRQNLLSDTGR